jgi:hypothetical protein
MYKDHLYVLEDGFEEFPDRNGASHYLTVKWALSDKFVYNGTDTKAACRAGRTDRRLQVRARERVTRPARPPAGLVAH